MKTIKRRRQEHRTDYHKRINLLKSESPRVVFRKTNRYLLAQYVTSREAQDKVEIGVDSRELLEFGWPKEASGSLKSIPASYLVGLLIGKKILESKKETPIVDFGMNRAIHKSKLFAFLNGLVDAGIKMKCDEKSFPEKERISGEHLKNKIPFSQIKSKVEKSK